MAIETRLPRLRRRSRLGVTAALFGALLSTGALRAKEVISGTVTYRERVALPADAELVVRLEDVSRLDVAATVVAQATTATAGRQVPIPFELSYDPSAIEPRMRYAIRAELRHRGRVLFRTTQAYPVLTHGGASSAIEVVLSRASGSTAPPLRELDAPVSFGGTIPCADCPGIRVTLTLFDDGTYRRRDIYLEGKDGEDLPVLEAGRWRLEEGRRVVLTSEGRRAGALEVITSDELRFLGAEDRPIEADLPFELYRLPDVDPLDDSTSAGDEASLCFGNEPSWSLDLGTSGEARLVLLGEEPVVYRGRETRNEPLREAIWRGAARSGGGDLVAFLADGDCSDGMSDATHPRTARMSLPDGRFLVGCCRVPGTRTEPGAAAAGPSLEGVTWRLVSHSALDASSLASLQRPVTLRFEDDRVTGFSGCNQVSGSYRIEGEKIALGPLVATRMACAEALMQVESAVHRALSGSPRFAVEGGRLELQADSGTLVFEVEAPASIEGSYEITGYNNGRGGVTSPLSQTPLTLELQDGRVTGNAGCNTYRGTYTVDGERLALTALATTRRACPGEGVMEQEREILAALERAARWSATGEGLEIFAGGGERLLTARRTGE